MSADEVVPRATTHLAARAALALALAAGLGAALLYSRALAGELVYDDLLLVERNPALASWSGLARAFSGAYWDFLDAESASRIGYWRPLSALGLTLGWQLGGGTPPAFHALSIALHACASALAALVAFRLLGRALPALFAGLFFALHSAHVESVAWISALNDPLHGVLGLWALERHIAWRAAGSRRPALAAPALFLAALLAKEMAVALILLAPLADLALSQRAERIRSRLAPRALLADYAPWLAALGIYVLARMFVFASPLAGFDRTTTELGFGWLRSALARVELVSAALHMLLEPGYAPLFRPFQPELRELWSGAIVPCAAALAAGLAALACWRRGPRLAAIGLLFAGAALTPLLARIESVGQFPMSSRFLYLAVLGFALCLAAAADALASRGGPARRALAWCAPLALVAWQAWAAARRIPVWHDEERLFRAAALESPASAYAHWGLGRVLLGRWREDQQPRSLQEAFASFERAQDLCERARIDPTLWATREDGLQSSLGVAWCLLHEAAVDEFRDFETPRAIFERLIELEPRSDAAWIGKAACLELEGRADEARAALERAIELAPRNPEARHNLGVLLLRGGRPQDARAAFEAARALRPGRLDDAVWTARAAFEAGDLDGAEAAAELARAAHPSSADPLVILASVARRRGELARALALADRARELEPRDAFAWYVGAQVLVERGQREAALESFRRACELDALDFAAHYNAGALLLELGRPAEALAYLMRAYERALPGAELEDLELVLRSLAIESADVLHALGVADSTRGRRAAAIHWLRAETALAPARGESQLMLGRLLTASGDDEQARAAMAAAAGAMPDSFQARYEHGVLLQRLGLAAEALAELRAATGLRSRTGKPELDEALEADARLRMRELE
jgi:tetratricopeptide (TPR) repeat protein